MSGDETVVVIPADDTSAEFAAGVATATAAQAAETAEQAEATAELALNIALGAEAASQTAIDVAVDAEEDDMSQAELDAFKAETQSTLAAILDRLDSRDAETVADEETAGPPAPAPKDDEGQADAPEKDDAGDDAPADSGPPRKSKSDAEQSQPRYGARAWFGK